MNWLAVIGVKLRSATARLPIRLRFPYYSPSSFVIGTEKNKKMSSKKSSTASNGPKIPEVMLNGETQPQSNNALAPEGHEITKIEFRRREGLFGFNIVGGSDQAHIPGHTGIFVTRIRPDSPAGMDGRLKVGDRIISANGTDLTNIRHQEAVDILRNLESVCTLMVEPGAESRILAEPAIPAQVESIPDNPISTTGKPQAIKEIKEIKENVPVPVPIEVNGSTKLSMVNKSPAPPVANGPEIKINGQKANDGELRTGVTKKDPQESNGPPSVQTEADNLGLIDSGKRRSVVWPPAMPETFYVGVGVVALGIAGYLIYRRLTRSSS